MDTSDRFELPTKGVKVHLSTQPNLNSNGIPGDILFQEDDEDVKCAVVKLRGSDEIVQVDKGDIMAFLLKDPSTKVEEELRLGLYTERAKQEPPQRFLKEMVLAVGLADELAYLILRPEHHDALPKDVQGKILARLAEAYYYGRGNIQASPTGGRDLPAYARALQPFLAVLGSPDQYTGEEAVPVFPLDGCYSFPNLLLADPTNSAGFLLRAFAFVQWRLDNHFKVPEESLVDAFNIAFAAIQVLRGSIPTLIGVQDQIDASLQLFFHNYGSDFVQKMVAHGLATGGQNPALGCLQKEHLLWNFCHQFFSVGFIARARAQETRFEFLLPNPYNITTVEQARIGALAIGSAPECPQTYLQAYQMTMDVKEFVEPGMAVQWLGNAFQLVRKGKEVADQKGDPLYRCIFRMLEMFWIPTCCWDCKEKVTFTDVEKRIASVKEMRRNCSSYQPAYLFRIGEHHQREFDRILSALRITAEKQDFCLSDLQLDPWIYCGSRFACPGQHNKFHISGDLSKLKSKLQFCAGCRKQLVPPFLPCSFCQALYYCSKSCQGEDWTRGHESTCPKTILRCGNCKVPVAQERSCALCRSIHYCDKPCQAAHWKKGHKHKCPRTATK